jgi:hypothetical protein
MKEPAIRRPRASIAGPLHESVFHSLCMIEKPWKTRLDVLWLTHFPHLWRDVWRYGKSLQIAVIGRVGHGEFLALRGGVHAAMLAAPQASEED